MDNRSSSLPFAAWLAWPFQMRSFFQIKFPTLIKFFTSFTWLMESGFNIWVNAHDSISMALIIIIHYYLNASAELAGLEYFFMIKFVTLFLIHFTLYLYLNKRKRRYRSRIMISHWLIDFLPEKAAALKIVLLSIRDLENFCWLCHWLWIQKIVKFLLSFFRQYLIQYLKKLLKFNYYFHRIKFLFLFSHF